jgi:hypothetical protein
MPTRHSTVEPAAGPDRLEGAFIYNLLPLPMETGSVAWYLLLLAAGILTGIIIGLIRRNRRS